MRKFAKNIVKYRMIFLAVFVFAAIVSVFTSTKVVVINELTDYLPKTTETRQGVDIMDNEFTTFASAKVMIQNISYADAQRIAESIEKIKGVSSVAFYEEDDDDDEYKDFNEITDAEALRDVYTDCTALLNITFDTPEEDEQAQVAIANVRKMLSDYDTYFYTTIDKDDSAELKNDMKQILVLVLIVIIGVILFTSSTYMEIPIFMLVFGMAALLNSGTNFMFGSISYISNAVGTVLQLALAIDYAIIMFHRFMEEREDHNNEEALVRALTKAIPEISSSSLTTVAGMVALMFMQFGIGPDLGRVMTKAIILSMVSVFFFMPALIMNFTEQIEKTGHKSFVPRIDKWGRFVVRSRFICIPLFSLVMIASIYLSSKCGFIYDKNSVQAAKMNEFLTSKKEISQYFDMNNTMAILVPPGDYESEAEILKKIEKFDRVESTLGLANVSVDEDECYVLTDKLSPQEFAEVSDLDLDTCRLLYRFFAWKQERYGAFLNGIDEFRVSLIDMIDFIYGEEKNESFDFDAELSQDIEDMHKQVSDARSQLEGENYDRLIFTTSGPVEGKEVFELIDQIRDIAYEYYNEAYVVGDSTSDYDLSKSFLTDNMKISIMTGVFVLIILFFTFDNISIPVVLVATIQSAIWINFSIPYLTNSDMFFLSYLIVSSIQMGATIDYAIVITTRYTELRQENSNKELCIIETLNQSLATIVTSGTILTIAAFCIGFMTSNSTIASLGGTLGKGTLISIILVMLILPQLLYIFDGLFQKSYWRNKRIYASGAEIEGNEYFDESDDNLNKNTDMEFEEEREEDITDVEFEEEREEDITDVEFEEEREEDITDVEFEVEFETDIIEETSENGFIEEGNLDYDE